MFFLSCYIREIQVRYFLKWWSQKRKQYLVCIILMQTSTLQDVLPLLSTSAIAWRHQHAAHTAKPCLRCHKTGHSAYLVERGRKHAFDCNSASAPYRNRDTKNSCQPKCNYSFEGCFGQVAAQQKLQNTQIQWNMCPSARERSKKGQNQT